MKIISDSGIIRYLWELRAYPPRNKPGLMATKITWLGQLFLELALAGIFLYSGLQKHLHPNEFIEAVMAYKILPLGLVGVTAAIIPSVECAAGLLLALGCKKRSCLLLLGLLICVFLGAMLITMIRGLNIDCGCSLFLSRQVGWVAFMEDSLLLVLAGGLYCREVFQRHG
jgi:putative oxidoreductase